MDLFCQRSAGRPEPGFLTPGLVIGRFKLAEGVAFTWGVGYQFAVSPEYRPNPLTPAYNHAWLLTTRLDF